MCYCYNELSEKTDFIMVSQSPYKVHTKPRRNGLVTGRSFAMKNGIKENIKNSDFFKYKVKQKEPGS